LNPGQPDLVSGSDRPFTRDREIEAASAADPEPFHHVGTIEPDAELEARHAGQRDLKERRADRQRVPRAHVRFEHILRGEILAELAGFESGKGNSFRQKS